MHTVLASTSTALVGHAEAERVAFQAARLAGYDPTTARDMTYRATAEQLLPGLARATTAAAKHPVGTPPHAFAEAMAVLYLVRLGHTVEARGFDVSDGRDELAGRATYGGTVFEMHAGGKPGGAR